MACFLSDDISVVPFYSLQSRQDFFIYEYGVVWFERRGDLTGDWLIRVGFVFIADEDARPLCRQEIKHRTSLVKEITLLATSVACESGLCSGRHAL
jgi:hypothetical protein